MISSNFESFVTEFIERARKIKEMNSLVLFGSVARGEAAKCSDLDLLAILKHNGEFSKAAEELRNIEMKVEEKGANLELVVMSEEEFRNADKNFIENIIREGILLLGKPVYIMAGELELKPYVIFIYYMKDLDQLNKQRLHIALYGHTTKKRVGKKVYRSETKGWIEKGAKLERKVVMFPEEVAKEVKKIFERFGAKYYEIKIYAPIEEFEKIRRFI